MHRILSSKWPSIIWTAIVFYLLAMPTDGIDTHGMLDFYGSDKIIHFVLFALMGFLWLIYIQKEKSSKSLFISLNVIIAISIFGLGMEYYQKYFTLRNFSLYDALFDFIGTAAGVFIAKKSPY